MLSLLLALSLNASSVPNAINQVTAKEPTSRGSDGRQVGDGRHKAEKYVPPNHGGPDSRNGTGTRIGKLQK